jgi:hypothetical protein
VATNLDTILGALYTAVEAVTPTALASVPFKRWRGPGILGNGAALKPAPSMRTFQWQLGQALTPNTISGMTSASTWSAHELILVVAYDLTLPRPWDTNGLGPSFEIGNDATELWTLIISNPLRDSTYHCKPLVPQRPWGSAPAPFVRYRMRFEFTRS